MEILETGKNTGNEPVDSELIAAYLAGDSGSFDVLYERYRRILYAYLNNLLRERGPALADDLFQQTWLKAIDNLHRYQDREKFSAWLMRIAYNLAIDSFRASKRRAEEEFDDSLEAVLPASDSSLPDSELESAELANALESAIAELSPDIRAVFLMRREDISFREIAEIQNCSINTCLARMQYALKNLRRSMAGWLPQK